MKVRVVLTDDNGDTFEGEAALVAVSERRAPRRPRRDSESTSAPRSGRPDFSLPPRAFVRLHVKGLGGGGQKFTVLLARLTGGKGGQAVPLSDVEKAWNRMTELMDGKFYAKYAQRAKDEGRVDTPKTGHYALRSSWADALTA
jgi:hypothetical protein